MAHYIGKINLTALVNVVIADVEYDDEVKKCVVIPIKDNGIEKWNDEYQLWFRMMHYLKPMGKFTHFLMKYIPRKSIKKMSQAQIEQLSQHRIGNAMKSSYGDEEEKTRGEGTPEDPFPLSI